MSILHLRNNNTKQKNIHMDPKQVSICSHLIWMLLLFLSTGTHGSTWSPWPSWKERRGRELTRFNFLLKAKIRQFTSNHHPVILSFRASLANQVVLVSVDLLAHR